MGSVKIFTKDDPDCQTSYGVYKPVDRSLNINLDAGLQHGGVVRATTFKYASIVVHEMLHAFLHIYSCHCGFCMKRRKVAVNGNSGASGHSPLFLNACRAIELAIKGEFGRDFDTGLYESLKLEMEGSGWQPREDQFHRWGLIYFEVEQGQVWENASDNEGKYNLNRGGKGRQNAHRDGEESDEPWDGNVLCCDVM